MSAQSKPLVSVVMPLYNGARFVSETIESILGQSLSNIELIIVNDGSTDESRDIVLSFDDPRIIFHEFEQNRGMAKARNKGIELARADIVAMTDQDDISHKRRLEEQVRFLDSNLRTMLVGTWARHFGEKGWLYAYETESPAIKIRMLGNSQFCHPSVAFRRSLIRDFYELYQQEYAPADDYKMLCDVCARYDANNLPKELLSYRVHDKQESTIKTRFLENKADRVRIEYLEKIFDTEFEPKERELHLESILPRQTQDRMRIKEQIDWLVTLVSLAPDNLNKVMLKQYFSERLIGTVCSNISTFGLGAVRIPSLIPFDRPGKTHEILKIFKAILGSKLGK